MSDGKDIEPESPPIAPKRRGRPTLYEVPLTPAERARRYRRARKSAPESVTDCSDAVLMERLRFAMKWKAEGGAAEAQDALNIYLEELVRRHHSGDVQIK